MGRKKRNIVAKKILKIIKKRNIVAKNFDIVVLEKRPKTLILCGFQKK